MKVPKEQIERRWAESLGVTLGEFYQTGFMAVPCSCGTLGCEGWQLSLDGQQFWPYLKAVDATQ